VEASGATEALAKMDRHPVGAVIVSLPSSGANRLVQEMRRLPALKAIPVITLGERAEHGENMVFDACVDRFDRDALLHSLHRLASAVGNHETPEQEPALAGSRKLQR